MSGMARSVRHECLACGQSVWVDKGRFQDHKNQKKRCSGSGKEPGKEK